jgi:WD40-like Beta Propeller Repeat
MKNNIKVIGIFLLIIFLSIIGLIFNGMFNSTIQDKNIATAAPLSDTTNALFTNISSPFCLVSQKNIIQTTDPQGNLLAWSPIMDAIAYISASPYGWYIGDLVTASAPSFTDTIIAKRNVFGDISWSPDGNKLAFVSLDQNDGLYTIYTADPDGSHLVDLYPGNNKKTDPWSSPKAIYQWKNNNELVVSFSCGVGCINLDDVSLLEGTHSISSSTSENISDFLDYTNIIKDNNEYSSLLTKIYSANINYSNWSPNGLYVAILIGENNANNLWVVKPKDKVQFPLDVGGLSKIFEVKWSNSGKFLAVRAQDKLLIFSVECK